MASIYWPHVVVLLAIVQMMVFGILVGRARGRYDVKAPATTGHEMFDRYYRVQMNTLELMVLFLPAILIAAQYWSPGWMAAIGAVYLVGRQLYLSAYTKDPAKRGPGFALSYLPIMVLVIAALAGVLFAG